LGIPLGDLSGIIIVINLISDLQSSRHTCTLLQMTLIKWIFILGLPQAPARRIILPLPMLTNFDVDVGNSRQHIDQVLSVHLNIGGTGETIRMEENLSTILSQCD
jgi:hypothetical protein